MKKKEKEYYERPTMTVVQVEAESALAAGSPDTAQPIEPFDPETPVETE